MHGLDAQHLHDGSEGGSEGGQSHDGRERGYSQGDSRTSEVTKRKKLRPVMIRMQYYDDNDSKVDTRTLEQTHTHTVTDIHRHTQTNIHIIYTHTHTAHAAGTYPLNICEAVVCAFQAKVHRGSPVVGLREERVNLDHLLVVSQELSLLEEALYKESIRSTCCRSA